MAANKERYTYKAVAPYPNLSFIITQMDTDTPYYYIAYNPPTLGAYYIRGAYKSQRLAIRNLKDTPGNASTPRIVFYSQTVGGWFYLQVVGGTLPT